MAFGCGWSEQNTNSFERHIVRSSSARVFHSFIISPFFFAIILCADTIHSRLDRMWRKCLLEMLASVFYVVIQMKWNWLLDKSGACISAAAFSNYNNYFHMSVACYFQIFDQSIYTIEWNWFSHSWQQVTVRTFAWTPCVNWFNSNRLESFWASTDLFQITSIFSCFACDLASKRYTNWFRG